MLTVDNLSFGFHSHLLFEKISFQVRSGDLLHIAGANGAGKTSLLNVLANLYAPHSGRITFDKSLTKEYLASETNGLYLHLSAVDNLLFWTRLRGHRLTRAACNDILTRWCFPSLAIRQGLTVKHFSTGMKRKLALIRLACSQTNLWLLDEPILGLDQASIALFSASLNTHLKAGGAAILVSHDTTALRPAITQTLSLSQEGAA